MAEFNDITVHGVLRVTGDVKLSAPLSIRCGGTGNTSFHANSLLMVSGDGLSIGELQPLYTSTYDIKAGSCNSCSSALSANYAIDSDSSSVKIYASYYGEALSTSNLVGFAINQYKLVRISPSSVVAGNSNRWGNHSLNVGSISSTVGVFSIL